MSVESRSALLFPEYVGGLTDAQRHNFGRVFSITPDKGEVPQVLVRNIVLGEQKAYSSLQLQKTAQFSIQVRSSPPRWFHTVINGHGDAPMELSGGDISDMYQLGEKWAYDTRQRLHKYHNPDANYPDMGWERAHLEVRLAIGKPMREVGLTRKRISDFQYFQFNNPYWNVYVEALEPLGLVYRMDGVNIVANPTGRTGEIILVTDKVERMPNGSLSKATSEVLEWGKKHGSVSFEASVSMPRLDENLFDGKWNHFITFTRIYLLGLDPAIAADPFKMAASFAIFQEEKRNRLIEERDRARKIIMHSRAPSPASFSTLPYFWRER